MSDNQKIAENAASTVLAATDEVIYSGNTAQVQIVRPVLVTGSEGSKTVVDLPGDNTNGLDVDVTRLPALPAGNNNIGDVDVSTLPVAFDTGAISATTQRVTTATNDPVVLLLTSLYTTEVTSSGFLALIDDIVYADNAAWVNDTSKHALMGGLYQSTPQTITDGRTGPIQVDSNGNVKVAPISLPVAFNTGTISATTQRVVIATDDAVSVNLTSILSNLAAVTYVDNEAWVDDTSFHFLIGGLYQSSPQAITDGRSGPISLDNLGRVRTNDTNGEAITAILNGQDESSRQKVNPIVGQAGLQGGSGAVSANTVRTVLATDVALPTGTNSIGNLGTVTTLTGSGIAHDSPDSGNPHKIGAKATASVLGETPVAANDRSDIRVGTDGVLLQRPHSSLEDIISEVKTNTDGASTAMTGAFAATASQRIYLTTLIIANSSASNITVDIRDGSAGSVLITVPVPANGGAVINFPIPLRFSANTAAAFDGSAAATTLTVSMVGFKSKT